MKHLISFENSVLLENNLIDQKEIIKNSVELTTSMAILSLFYFRNSNYRYALAMAAASGNSWMNWKIKKIDSNIFEIVKNTKEGNLLFTKHYKLYDKYSRNIDDLENIFNRVVKELNYEDIPFENFINFLFNDKIIIFKIYKYNKIKEYIEYIDKSLIMDIKQNLKDLSMFKDRVISLYDHLKISGKIQ